MTLTTIASGDIFAPGSAFAQCHASTLVALPDGHLMAAWFAGTAESDPDAAISYWQGDFTKDKP